MLRCEINPGRKSHDLLIRSREKRVVVDTERFLS
jgi:hypothetical protein